MLVDLRSFDADLSGKKARLALDRAGISLNENTVPDDPRPPYITSGLRIGTPAVTTQGMGAREMREIASLIHRALVGREDAGRARRGPRRGRRPLLQVPAVLEGRAPRPCPPRPSTGWSSASPSA